MNYIDSLVSSVIAGNLRVIRHKGAQRDLANYVFNDTQTENQLDRLMPILIGMVEAYNQRPDEVEQIVYSQLNRFFQQMLINEAEELFFACAGQCFDYILNTSMPTAEFEALHIFIDFCCDSYAATVERSMRLALGILKAFSTAQEIFSLGNVTEFETSRFTAIRLNILKFSASSFGKEEEGNIISARWLDTLITEAKHNSAVEEVLGCLFNILSGFEINADSQSRSVGWERLRNEITLDLTLGSFVVTDRDVVFAADNTPSVDPNFEIPDKLWRQMSIFFNRVEERQAQFNRASAEIVDAFVEQTELWRSNLERKRREILTQVKRTIRANGADHIEIRVPPLYQIGIRSVVLIPDEEAFPNLKLRIIKRTRLTPHLCVYLGRLEKLQLRIDRYLVDNTYEYEMTVMRDMLEVVVIDILHRILVECRELLPKTQKGEKDKHSAPTHHPVRGRIRKLPQGHNASIAALERAESAMGWKQLPDGMTFVKAHFRGNRLVYTMPTEPVAIYSDRDLFEGLERRVA